MINKKNTLQSYLYQLIDLKEGHIEELVLTKDNEAIEYLKEAIELQVKNLETMIEMEEPSCTKCGNEILSEENNLCGRCI